MYKLQKVGKKSPSDIIKCSLCGQKVVQLALEPLPSPSLSLCCTHYLAQDGVEAFWFTVHHHKPLLFLFQVLKEHPVSLLCGGQNVDRCHLPVLLGSCVQDFLQDGQTWKSVSWRSGRQDPQVPPASTRHPLPWSHHTGSSTNLSSAFSHRVSQSSLTEGRQWVSSVLLFLELCRQ